MHPLQDHPLSNTRSRDGRKGRMAVQFAQPYRFSEQQLARMARAGVVPEHGTELIEGVPYWAGTPFRFSSEDYVRLVELGVLSGEDRVELMDGEVIEMSPEGSRHSACIRRLMRFLVEHAGEAIIGSQDSLSLPDGYWPQPDIVVLRPDESDYEDMHPTHLDTLVVAEVADSSMRLDRDVKAVRYAQAGIPEFWLVDLKRNRIFVHRVPDHGAYQDVRVYGSGESWVSGVLGGLNIPVDVILKPR
jgi:Uma2 family endonuclease